MWCRRTSFDSCQHSTKARMYLSKYEISDQVGPLSFAYDISITDFFYGSVSAHNQNYNIDIYHWKKYTIAYVIEIVWIPNYRNVGDRRMEEVDKSCKTVARHTIMSARIERMDDETASWWKKTKTETGKPQNATCCWATILTIEIGTFLEAAPVRLYKLR